MSLEGVGSETMHAGGSTNRGSVPAAVGGLRHGLLLLPEAARFLRRERRLWFLSLVPIALTTAAVLGAISLFMLGFDTIQGAWLSRLPVLEAGEWWSWIWVGPGIALFWLIGWIGVILAFALALVAALLVANLLSAPFLDRLSQRVEEIVRGEAPTSSDGLANLLFETGRSLLAELQRLLFFVAIWTALTLVGFAVPGAHLVTAPLLVGVTMALLPLDYAGFALDRRGLSFRVRRRWLWSNLSTMIGFGGVAFVACLVPGLNLLILPALVTAGTLLVVRVTPYEEGPSGSHPGP